MNPNHYLSVAIDYLFRTRPGWQSNAAIGKTLCQFFDDRPRCAGLGRHLAEVPSASSGLFQA